MFLPPAASCLAKYTLAVTGLKEAMAKVRARGQLKIAGSGARVRACTRARVRTRTCTHTHTHAHTHKRSTQATRPAERPSPTDHPGTLRQATGFVGLRMRVSTAVGVDVVPSDYTSILQITKEYASSRIAYLE